MLSRSLPRRHTPEKPKSWRTSRVRVPLEGQRIVEQVVLVFTIKQDSSPLRAFKYDVTSLPPPPFAVSANLGISYNFLSNDPTRFYTATRVLLVLQATLGDVVT